MSAGTGGSGPARPPGRATNAGARTKTVLVNIASFSSTIGLPLVVRLGVYSASLKGLESGSHAGPNATKMETVAGAIGEGIRMVRIVTRALPVLAGLLLVGLCVMSLMPNLLSDPPKNRKDRDAFAAD